MLRGMLDAFVEVLAGTSAPEDGKVEDQIHGETFPARAGLALRLGVSMPIAGDMLPFPILSTDGLMEGTVDGKPFCHQFNLRQHRQILRHLHAQILHYGEVTRLPDLDSLSE